MGDFVIRPYEAADASALWAVLEPVIRAGDTYAIDADLDRASALALWCGSGRDAFVAEEGGRVVGTYYIRANAAGGGRHVCNCGYVTAPAAAGHGVARRLCAHSMEVARARRFRAMQFNFVVATNVRAISLWRSLGFDTVGRLPGAFCHPEPGYVDALVMYKTL